MQLYRLTLSKPLKNTTDAFIAHSLVMAGVKAQGVRVLFRIESRSVITVLAGDGAFEPRTLGAKLSDVQVRKYAPRVEEGTEYIFRVRLCPAKRPKQGGLTRLETQEEVEELLERYGERGGFQVSPHDLYIDWEPVQLIKTNPHATLPAITVEGRLRITDSACFDQVVATGIGRWRTFGFGLLQLAAV